MKLRLPHTLLRALMACFAALVSSSLATASSASESGVSLTVNVPDVEQGDTLLCWAASAADILAVETGQDAVAIYRCITEASGNVPGYVESALSWYHDGAAGELCPAVYDARYAVTRSGFDSLSSVASALAEALGRGHAASLTLYARGEGVGHAVTVYAYEYDGGRMFISCADSADGVQGVRRMELLDSGHGIVLAGTDYALASLSYLGEGDDDEAPAAPVGAYMHSSPLIQEYTDMAENRGIYRLACMPSLITYRNGEPDYALAVTPDFSPVADMGCYTLVNNGSFQLTVEHNGIMMDASFSGRYVGDYAQKYCGVGIRNNTTFVFGWYNPFVPMNEDYKVERISRLVTDASSMYYNTNTEQLAHLNGTTIYRVGAGNSGHYDTQGNINWHVGAWGAGITAGITQLAGSYDAGNGVYNVEYSPKNYEFCMPNDPLPSVGQPGDSGSPVMIYNAEQQRFEFVGPLQGASETFWISRYNPTATTAAIDYCTVELATAVDFNEQQAEATTIYISGAHVRESDMLIQDGNAATHLRQGSINLGGEEIARFNGVALDEFAEGTWKMLDADSLTWYTYCDNDYINARPDQATDAATFGTDDLFFTSNLHFTADSAGGATSAHRRIELTEDVDLGIGHVQFSLGNGVTEASYDLGQSSSDFFLSSAGFVVDEGVTLNNYFTYEKGRELRRVGLGTMNMVGVGNNDVLLNIGGGGVTFLNRTGGYAAYSALVNNKAVLRLADAAQVRNNVTLGAGGGVLDFNGNDYRWTSGGARAIGSDGWSYFGLTVYEGLNRVENSYIANYASGTLSTITIERADDFEFAGAFRDGSSYTNGQQAGDSRVTMMPSVLIDQYAQFSASQRQDSDSALRVIYNGGATMTMTGVYTVLTGGNAAGLSGFEVASGQVVLRGTNTIHAIGSESGYDLNRLHNPNDWHYAMAEMDVNVSSGASFELGDHALLIGDVQVESGGSFVMKQAVNERYEYVEGWYKAEDTYALADYYGLKGNVKLASGAAMTLRFDEGVATELHYDGSISGEGSLTVDAGKGSVHLTGENSFSGEKTVASGHLRVDEGAEGDVSTHKWLVQDAATLALEVVSSNAELERLVDAASTGVLALTKDFSEQLSFSGLIAGAAAGETVHYGTSAASLLAREGQWVLGGGGGALLVDFLLEGSSKLVLGNEHGTGTVVLTNAGNNFSGGIEFAGGVTLGYTSTEALGNNVLTIGYGRSLAALEGAAFAAGKVNTASDGVFALSDGSANVDFSQHGSLSLGAYGDTTFTGSLTVAEGASYRLGGAGALTVASELGGAHGIVIDGQGTTGSRVTFATVATATGDVLVQGYDANKAGSGDVTLSFSTDHALAAASSIMLRNNAGMDLNGTNQRFNNLTGDEGSLIFDDKGGNTLTLSNAEDLTLGVRVQAAGTDVVKTGSGTLLLTGENLWKSLSIEEGVVQYGDSKALGYLASGSQGIAVSVNAGAMLHVTADSSFDNTLNIAGFGVDGASYALRADGHLNNTRGTLNVTADAAIAGQFSFRQLNLQGNELTVRGNGTRFLASAISGGGGKLVIDNATVSGLTGSDYELELNNATFYVSQGSFAGALSVGVQGATIEYPWNDSAKGAFNLTGFVSGAAADSTLKLVGYKHTINLSGGAELAGKVEVGNGLTLNITKDASVGALINQTEVGDLSTVVVDGSTLQITGSGNNFGSNGNPGTIELTNEGCLQLAGLADGSSMGTFGTLNMGSNGVIGFTSLAGYGENTLLHIGSLQGEGSLKFDAAELASLAAGTYHLLTSGSDLSALATLPAGLAGGRRELTLASSVQADGSYALDLTVAGVAANATWKGTGTLVAGSANAANITTDLATEDNTFMALDSLTITTADASSHDTLTLGGTIVASSVTCTGNGTVTLAQENGGAFAEGTNVILDAAGRLELGETTAIAGRVELKQGTLSASSTSLNATEGVSVTGDAHFELTSASHVTAGIDVAKDASLTVSFKADSMADQWGGNFDDNLSGAGSLLVAVGSGNELHLNGNHTAFTGSITVQSGTLQLGLRENGSLTSADMGARSISVANGATLALSSAATTVAADIAWEGGSTLQVKDGAEGTIAYTLSGRQTLAGELKISHAEGKTTHISGDIEGSGSLNFVSGGNGTPSIILSGNNSYSGGTTINRSGLTVYAANANALGTGTITLQNGTLSWLGVGNGWNGDLAASEIVLTGSANFNTNGQDVTYSGKVSNGNAASPSLTKSGAGTLTFTNFEHTGATHVQEGTLAVCIAKNSWYTGFSGEEGATLRLSTSSRSGSYLMGAMSGGMKVVLDGDFGYVAANTHTGGTELRSGSLEIGNVNALKSGPLHAHEGTVVSIVMEKTYMAGDSVVDALSFGSGASVQVGADAAAGSLSFGSLSGTASFLLDVFSADSYDSLSGVLTPGSLLAVDLKASELGSYLLVAGNNSGYDTSAISLSGGDSARYSYSWSNTAEGLTLTIDYATGTVNLWTGGSGDWDSNSANWNGQTFSSGLETTVVRATQNTAIRVTEAVATQSLLSETAEGATLSFSAEGGSITAGTLQKDGEGTLRFEAGSANNFSNVVVNEGTLSVSDGQALGTSNITGNGTFELRGGSMSISADSVKTTGIAVADGSLTVDSTLDSRRLEIGSGGELRMGFWDNLNNSSILLRDGGKLAMQSSGCNNNTISVEGAGTFAIGQTCDSADGNKVLDINSDISGAGMLTLTNETSKSEAVYQVNINKVMADGSKGALALATDQGNLHLKVANTYSGGTVISGGAVTTHNSSALGTGEVRLTGGTLSLASALNIGSLSGTGGKVEAGEHDLHIHQTKAGSYAGDIASAATITKSGAASLSLTGENLSARTLVVQEGILHVDSIALSEGLAMTQEGSALTIGTLKLAEGAMLDYSSASGNVSIGTLQAEGAFTLNLADSLQSYLFGKTAEGSYNALDLGVNLGASAGLLTVSGLGLEAGMYTIGHNAVTGNSTLQLTSNNPWHVEWDANWGVENAPLSAPHTTLAASGGFAGTAYDDGSRIVVGVSGTQGVVDLYATTGDNAGGVIARDAWVEVEGGSYGVIAGANGGGGARSIHGDVHLMVHEGSVDRIIGFNDAAAGAPEHIGNSYISVGADAVVNDSVIGAGTSEIGTGGTLKGNTNVYVYSVLSSNGELNAVHGTGDERERRYNAIIGGFARTAGYGVEWKIDGSTNVVVDVSDYAGDEANFVKSIYGGNVSDTYSHIGTITGDTNVSISANDKVTFTENIVAGSLKGGDESWRADTIQGNTTVTINGGVIAGGGAVLTGGSLVSGGTSTIGGTASVILNGGIINRDVYAAGISNGGTSTVGASLVEIGKDATFGNVTVSGGFGGTSTSAGTVTGNRTLSLQDGVDLSATAASFTNFSHVEVASGSAILNIGAYAARKDTNTGDGYTYSTMHYEKVGAGTLEIVGSPGENYARFDIKGGTLRLGEATALGYTTTSSGSTLTTGRVRLYDGTLDINGVANYHNAQMFDVDSGYITFDGDGDMLVKNSSADASSGLGFSTASSYQAVTYRGTGRAEISANIVNCGQASPGNKIRFDVSSAGKGADFVELTLSGDIGADHSANERYMFGITKEGAGTMLLSGNNGYAGGTDVLGGTLIAAGDTVLGTGALKVASGATLEVAAGSHLSLEGGISFEDGSTLKLNSVDTTQAVLSSSSGWTLGGTLSLHISSELQAGTTYQVLGGLSSLDGITITGQEGYRYSLTTSLKDGVYTITAGDYEGGRLTWVNESADAVWSSGEELWTMESGEPSETVGSASKDTVVFGADGSRDVTVAEEGVKVNAVQVEADGYRLEGGSMQADEVTVSNDATVSLGAVYTVSQQDSGREASIGKVEMGADREAGTGYIYGTGSELTKLDNVVIDIAKGQHLELRDVLLSESSRITDDPATLSLDNVTLTLGSSNTVVGEKSLLPEGVSLLNLQNDQLLTLDAQAEVLYVFCSALDTVNVTGTSLTLDLSALVETMADDWAASEYLAVNFGLSEGSLAHFDTTGLVIRATFDGFAYSPVYVRYDERTAAPTLYVPTFTASIPEPTTATLSLLALAVLAMRRRRKD